jgi:glutamine cyclotransferase
MYGQSSVRLVDMKTGSVIREHKMDDSDFGEGLTKLGDTYVLQG